MLKVEREDDEQGHDQRGRQGQQPAEVPLEEPPGPHGPGGLHCQ